MATEEKLKITISADNADAVASLNELSQQLKKFEKGVKEATSGSDLLAFNKGLTETRAKMEVLNNSLNPITAQTKNLAVGSNQAAQALTNVGRVAQDLPFGFMGIQNNLNPLLESFQRLKTETGSSVGALKALGSSLIGAGGIGLALSVASSAFLLFGDRLFESGKKAEEAKKAFDSITAGIAKDAATIAQLVEKYKDSNLTLGQRKTILEELNKISPEYFSGLDKENTSYKQLTQASDDYIKSLTKQVQLKVLQAQYEKNVDKLLQNQVENEKVRKIQADFANKNKTGAAPVGLPTNAKLERENKLLLDQIASLTKIEDQAKKVEVAKIGGTSTGAKGPKYDGAKLFDERLSDEMKFFNDSYQIWKQNEDRKQAELLRGRREREQAEQFDVQIMRDSGKVMYDNDQAQKQQMLLGIEQSRLSALDEMNQKFKEQQSLAENVGNAFANMLSNVANAKNPFEALTQAVKQLVIDLGAAALKMVLIKALVTAINPAAGAAKGIGGILGGIIGFGAHAEGGVTTGPSMGLIGEAGPEAILPLDRFRGFVDQAGRMGALSAMGSNANSGGGSGEFVLRGTDLVLAMQRSNYSLNLRRG
jgi:hypothetical protein